MHERVVFGQRVAACGRRGDLLDAGPRKARPTPGNARPSPMQTQLWTLREARAQAVDQRRVLRARTPARLGTRRRRSIRSRRARGASSACPGRGRTTRPRRRPRGTRCRSSPGSRPARRAAALAHATLQRAARRRRVAAACVRRRSPQTTAGRCGKQRALRSMISPGVGMGAVLTGWPCRKTNIVN